MNEKKDDTQIAALLAAVRDQHQRICSLDAAARLYLAAFNALIQTHPRRAEAAAVFQHYSEALAVQALNSALDEATLAEQAGLRAALALAFGPPNAALTPTQDDRAA
jgi:hypothetical protein